MKNEKLKVLYVITKSNWGGAQKYVFELATSLPKDQFEAVVLSGGNGILSDKLKSANIKTITLANLERDINIFKEIYVLFGLIKIFRSERPDIIHLNSSKIGGLGALAARIYNMFNKLTAKSYKLKANTLFTAHGFAFNEDRPWLVKTILFLLNYITMILADKTIIINQREFDQIRYLPIIGKKIRLIHIGIRPTKSLEITKNIDGPIAIGTIAELTNNKGLEFTIEAISRLKNRNITFTIIGEGEERSSLEALIQKLKIADKVLLLGFKENATRYLNLFDVFTLTSLKEGLPYSILEAGLAGLPVVASNVGGIGEIIEDEKSGFLVEPKNIDQIVEALTKLIDNKELRKTLGQNLKKIIEQQFSLATMIDKTLTLYKQRAIFGNY